MAFQLPELPYRQGRACAAHVGRDARFHWGKHHRAYVTKTNELIERQRPGGASLVDVVRDARASGDNKLFNNSAQLWNHSFFWQCLSPGQDSSRAASSRS